MPSPRVYVRVTEEIIRRAIPANSSHCMTAEAIRDALPDAQYVSVDIQTIRFSDPTKNERYIYLTPRSVQLAILDFDQGKEPAPFSFHLRGGQVTPMHRRGAAATPRESKPRSPAQVEALGKALAARGAEFRDPSAPRRPPTAPAVDLPKRRQLQPNVEHGARGVPEVVGGRPPRRFAMRRAFGLRGLAQK